eukprot:GHVN01069943.1.p1 GENE.GHVN01069943.1~~GHVN01069943.1.p1  ORF type:complete len:230 (+),score=23.95 GHVN01069943.1:184-873(+)
MEQPSMSEATAAKYPNVLPSVPVGHVPHGGVLYDQKGGLNYVLWYSSPFDPRDRIIYDLKKGVMFSAVWGGAVLFISFLLSMIAQMWWFAGVEFVLLLLVPLSGYFGASRDRIWMIIVFASCCVLCFMANAWWWTISFVSVIRIAAMSDEDFRQNYPTGASKAYSISLGVVSILLTMVIMSFWAYGAYLGFYLNNGLRHRAKRDAESNQTQMTEVYSGTQPVYGQYNLD